MLPPGRSGCPSSGARSPELQALLSASAKICEVLQAEEVQLEEDADEISREFERHIKGGPDDDGVQPGAEAPGRPGGAGGSDILELNVGGDARFATRRDTLTCVRGSRLAQIFSGRWDRLLPRDDNGRIFVDIDPTHFRILLDWLVDIKKVAPGDVVPSISTGDLPVDRLWSFDATCQWLGLQSKPEAPFPGSTILDRELSSAMHTLLREGSTLELLCRATRDGFDAQTFHRLCDRKGPTLVIARSVGGHIFGGYTETDWDISSGYKRCAEAFLFHLAGPRGIEPSKHPVYQNLGNGIYCNSSHCASFGGGIDLRIYSEAAAAKANFKIGHTYSAQGSRATRDHLAESSNVVVTEWEVFRVTDQANMMNAVSEFSRAVERTVLDEESSNFLSEVRGFAKAAVTCKDSLRSQRLALSQSRADLDSEVSFIRQFLGRGSGSSLDPSSLDRSGAEVVSLNVTGVIMATFRSTLASCPNTTLATKFGPTWKLQGGEIVGNAVFLDEDPALFTLVLQHLRHVARGFSPQDIGPPPVSSAKQPAFGRLLRYLAMHDLIDFNPFDSAILAYSEDHAALQSLLQGLNLSTARLLFRASRDGFSAQVFHQRCDRQGPTLLLSRTGGGYVFGGYTDAEWDSSSGYRACAQAFLFRLRGPGGARPSRHAISQNRGFGIFCDGGYCATFGGGHDLSICAEESDSMVRFSMGHTYSMDGTGGSLSSLAEAQSAVVLDWEIFSVSSV